MDRWRNRQGFESLGDDKAKRRRSGLDFESLKRGIMRIVGEMGGSLNRYERIWRVSEKRTGF